MASAFAYSVTLIFLVPQFVLLTSAQKQEQACPHTFECGSLGTMGYPFTTVFNPGCGIIVINCTEPHLSIGLSATGPWYEVIYTFSSHRSFLIGDKLLLNLVNDDTCPLFGASSFSIPKSSIVNVTNLHNETMLKCSKNSNASGTGNFRRLLDCDHYSIYNSNTSIESNEFSHCTLFQYPQFLMVELSDKCSDCISGGGHCQEPENDKFQCINKQKERRKFRLLLGLGIGGGSIIIALLGLLLLCRRKIKLIAMGLDTGKLSRHPMRMKTDIEKSKVYFSVPVFSYSELEEATNNFNPSRELGDGGFGTVYYGKLKDGREVAVKRLYERNCKQLEQYLNEIEILACLRHQNLVNLYGCTSRQSRELILVYEYLPNATVADHLYGDQAKCAMLSWPVRMRIAIETATALSYLHASDVIHRDVKTQNILLDHNFSVKVADFGLSRLFPINVTHISTAPQGTPGYLDPEYHQCYQLTEKSDVYSFGVVLVELISSLPAVDISRKDDEINLSNYAMKRIQCSLFDDLVDQRLGFNSNYQVKRMIILVAELAFQCLQHRKDFRPSMYEVLETLKRINNADNDVQKADEKEDNDIWLLKDTENPSSPNSVIYEWVSHKSDTPTDSR